ncbi:MAG: hypothetical protein COA38_08100 [Fluviicola sp.]|nr:MAG: hypothetical protein COA38_08100 [Fluviicola sp.]
MKQFLLSISILFLTLFCHAQELRIVKDNVKCSYGLKDKTGNWVIEPNYILIQEYNSGCFLVKDVLGEGMLSPKGEWIIECKYDRFDVGIEKWQLIRGAHSERLRPKATKSFFVIGIIGDRKSLLNSRGESIVEMALADKCMLDDGKHFLIHHSDPVRSSYIDTSGNIRIDKIPGVVLPFREKAHALHGDGREYYGSGEVNGHVRLINRNGDDLLNQEFDKALLLTRNRIAFERDSCYGVMLTNGAVIIRPKYRREERLGPPNVYTYGWVIFDKQGRRGVMNSGGYVLLVPKYDEISILEKGNGSQGGWIVSAGGKSGTIDTYGNWLVPLKFEQLIPFYALRRDWTHFQTNYMVLSNGKWGYLIPEVDSVPGQFFDSLIPITSYKQRMGQLIGRGFITKQNGKYGILHPDGSVYSPCIYDDYVRSRSLNEHHFLYRGHELKEFAFKHIITEERIWKAYLKVEDEIIFTEGSIYVSARLSSDRKRISSINQDVTYNVRHGNMHVIGIDTASMYLKIYNSETSKKIAVPNIEEISQFSDNLFTIRTSDYHHGLVDKDGNIILDTLYFRFEKNKESSDIWAYQQIKASVYKWTLFDTTGKQILPDLFDTRFEVNSGDQLLAIDRRVGIFDTKNYRWKIKPEHPCLIKTVGGFYDLVASNGKKGIMRPDGSYLLDPIYDSIILLSSDLYKGGVRNKGVVHEIRWLARQGNNEVLVDQNGKQLASKKTVRAFKESLMFADTLLTVKENIFRNYPVLDYSPSLHFLRGLTMDQIRRKRKELWINPILKSCVYDSINSGWEARKSNCSVYYNSISLGEKSESPEFQKVQRMCLCAQGNTQDRNTFISHRLISIGPLFVTVSKDYIMRNDWDHMRIKQLYAPPRYKHWNFIMKDGKAVSIELDDIFPKDKVLMREFIIALKKRDDLELECSSVETMIEMIGGKFSLSNQGVHLYLSQYNNYSNSYVELIIPTDNLAKHSGSSWIVPILKN